MISKPILFSAPMVRAILEGRKAQTRRKIAFPPSTGAFVCIGQEDGSWWPYVSVDGESTQDQNGDERPMKCPHPVGSEMWVKETWAAHKHYDGRPPVDIPEGVTIECRECPEAVKTEGNGHRAILDGERGRWRPSIFMRRWMSRITLTVTDVRVQLLQDISLDDARAEGIPQMHGDAVKAGLCAPTSGLSREPDCRDRWDNSTSVENYSRLWESINGPGSWAANPFVWKYVFEVKK